MSSNQVINYLIDDSDARLQYSEGWIVGGTSNEYQNTTHGTSTPDSHVTFAFNGTFIAAYATVGTVGVRYAYSLDGEDPVSRECPGAPQTSYKVQLFYLPDLSDTQHELTITLQSQEQPLWLDYLSYTGHEPPSVFDVGNQVSSFTPNPPSHRLSSGVIVAIVMASILSLTLVIILSVFTSRRWHRLRLTRPRQHKSPNEKTFEILPPAEQPSSGTQGVSISITRAPASQNTTVLSSSVFSSVIFNGTYNTGSIVSV